MGLKKVPAAVERMATYDPAVSTGAADAVEMAVLAPVAPLIAADDDGQERPLSGGSFIRIDGKLVQQEAE